MAERGGCRIKICGLSRPCDMQAANELKPDYIGFVFAKSRRQVTREQAAALKALLDPSIPAVGVFVDERPERIEVLVKEGIIDWVQLHGNETERVVEAVRARCGCPVIKAFGVRTAADVERARESAADYILLDQGKGGTGKTFDWKLAEGLQRPFFLAGGLGPDNLAAAAKMLHPFALDVSSGVETDGYKDRSKMEDCIRRIRNV